MNEAGLGDSSKINNLSEYKIPFSLGIMIPTLSSSRVFGKWYKNQRAGVLAPSTVNEHAINFPQTQIPNEGRVNQTESPQLAEYEDSKLTQVNHPGSHSSEASLLISKL